MITARLNRLLKAYRIAKQLFGEANQGRVVPGPVFRWCHKVRMAVWAEINLVRRFIPHIRAANLKQEKAMTYRTEVNDAGESPSASSRRQDDKAMKDIISALQDGAHLRIHTKVRRAAIEGLPDKDFRNGRTISAHRCKKLAKEGIIREVAMDRYAFNPDLELEAPVMDNKTARQDLETVIRVEDLALGSMRKLRRIQDWLRAQPEDMVPMPQNKDQARAMALTGMKWLEDNALEQLVHVGGVEPVITNEMKAECMGEFEFTIEESCSACYFDEPQDDCEVCQGSIHYDRKVSVPWTTCKEIYKRMTKASTGTTYQEKENIGTIGHIDYRRVASRAIADIATVTELLGVPEEEAGRPIVELVQEFLAAQSKDIEALRTILVDSVRLREPDFIIGDPNDPYLIRYWLRRDRPEGSIYLHCIRKSDDDRALHDHPWSSTSLVLEGTLREILPEGSRLLTPGTIVSRSAEQAHRLEVVDGPVWTLFITGAVEREWGFHCPNGWVHWKEFTDPATNGQQIGKGCGNE